MLSLAPFTPLLAVASTLSIISDKQLHTSIDMGDEIEARVDGDLNGDGAADCIYIVRSEDRRVVNVLLRANQKALLYRPVGEMKLENTRLNPASLSVTKGVLKIDDLTGGTTAMAAVYRLRFDPKAGRMRLIGLDATLYSRIMEHDGYAFSWNLMTSDLETKLLKLNDQGHAAYEEKYIERYKRVSKPLYMEDVEDPEMVMVDIRKK